MHIMLQPKCGNMAEFAHPQLRHNVSQMAALKTMMTHLFISQAILMCNQFSKLF
jgi:hypothetical protein